MCDGYVRCCTRMHSFMQMSRLPSAGQIDNCLQCRFLSFGCRLLLLRMPSSYACEFMAIADCAAQKANSGWRTDRSCV